MSDWPELNATASAAFDTFTETGEPRFADRAVDGFRTVCDLVPPDHPQRTMYLANLSVTLISRFERTGEATDLHEAVRTGRLALAAAPAGHPARAGRLSTLSSLLWTRYEYTGALDDLTEAVRTAGEAVTSANPGDPDMPVYLARFANTRFQSHLRYGDAAVTAAGRAVAATADSDPLRAGWWSNLGIYLRTRFERTGSRSDLDLAVHAAQQAVTATGDGDPDQARYLSDLGNSLRTRHHLTGSDTDLDQAIETGRRSVRATPAGADNAIRAGQAACSYSWRSPPSRSCRRMRRRARVTGSVIGSGSDCSGRALAMPRCGRC
ncbi:hypothetical protein SAMN04489716_9312 [Actinoplanes derwentensis]|uniref:Tetratricopeptide repeat-containing protein n=1 Tax=Actinoplanes derwentensis TaxID=113562 RepID=A0A1H2DDM1_9ACTN|nr:hypothetical protein SAMN04489716_9312 [Actinoplanes derwentensis]